MQKMQTLNTIIIISISFLLMTCENMQNNKTGNIGGLVGKGNSVQDSKDASQHGVFVLTKAYDSYGQNKGIVCIWNALSQNVNHQYVTHLIKQM